MNSVIDTMRKRTSIRTYADVPIQKETLEQIQEYIIDGKNLSGPLGNTSVLKLIPIRNGIMGNGEKIGTYGAIKNPQAFIAGITVNSDDAIVDYGYVFEKLVLFLTGLGLGTCWLGAYDRGSLYKLMQPEKGQVIPAITPIGYDMGRRRAFEAVMRGFVGAANRKPWRELFYKKDFNTPLDESMGDLINIPLEPLEMVRIAPSASNKQPWRLLITEEACHFYLAHTPGYMGNKMGYEVQRLDIGIAMYHFELACNELSIHGRWAKADPGLCEKAEPVYIISWSPC